MLIRSMRFFYFFFLVSPSLCVAAPERVLVTGANGFIGKHTVQMLLAHGVQVRVLVRDPSKLGEEFRDRVEIVQADLNDLSEVVRAVQGMDGVIHTAAYVSDFALDGDIYEAVNVVGTKNVVAAVDLESQNRRIRLVHFSTVDVVKFSPGVWVDERSPYEENSRYGYPASKKEAEKVVFEGYQRAQMMGNAQFELSVVRPTWVFGPQDKNFIPAIIKALKAGTPVLIGGPQKVVHLSYIENLMDVTWLLLTRPEAVGKAFISDDGYKKWGWVEDVIRTRLGIKRPWPRSISFSCGLLLGYGMEFWAKLTRSSQRPDLTPFAVKYLFSDLHYSSARLKKELGYTPRVSLEQGMDRTLQSYGL